MPRTALTVTESSKAGTVLAAGAAADVVNGNSVANDGKLLIVATNGGASTRTITITPAITVDGLAVSARTISLAASAVKLLGPYDTSTYSTTLAISADHADVKFQPIRAAGL